MDHRHNGKVGLGLANAEGDNGDVNDDDDDKDDDEEEVVEEEGVVDYDVQNIINDNNTSFQHILKWWNMTITISRTHDHTLANPMISNRV